MAEDMTSLGWEEVKRRALAETTAAPTTTAPSATAAASTPSHEVRVTNALTGGEKGSKPEAFALIPVEPQREVARVYGYGSKKYAPRNWEKGYDWSLSYSALQRHVNAFWGGENLDPETGLHHLAHAVFHCYALMEWGRTHPELDDRP